MILTLTVSRRRPIHPGAHREVMEANGCIATELYDHRGFWNGMMFHLGGVKVGWVNRSLVGVPSELHIDCVECPPAVLAAIIQSLKERFL